MGIKSYDIIAKLPSKNDEIILVDFGDGRLRVEVCHWTGDYSWDTITPDVALAMAEVLTKWANTQ